MSNICFNEFYITFDNVETKEIIINKLNDLFKNKLYGEIYYDDDYVIEGNFDSRWTFPAHIWNDFFDDVNDDSVYMRCLSTEYGCSYVAMNIYENESWKNEQCFDL